MLNRRAVHRREVWLVEMRRTQRGPTPSNGPRSQDLWTFLQASGEGRRRPPRRMFDNQLRQLSPYRHGPRIQSVETRHRVILYTPAHQLLTSKLAGQLSRLPCRSLPPGGAWYLVTSPQKLAA